MAEEKDKTPQEEGREGISRRQFLAGTGIVVGGAALGSMAILSACQGGGATSTVTSTVTKTVTATAPPGAAGVLTSFTVNGTAYALPNLKPNASLAQTLRETLGLTGTKTGCNRGECGTCTVIMDGIAVYSCLVPAVMAAGAKIETVEGLSDGITLSPVQKAMYDDDTLQCGFCAPGFIMSAKALLDKKPKPTFNEVREALSGHICTCGNTKMYIDAVLKV